MSIRAIHFACPSLFHRHKWVDKKRPGEIAVDQEMFEICGFRIDVYTTRDEHDGKAPKVPFFRWRWK